MKKYISYILTALLLSCTNKTKVPDYVIPQEDMVEILVDIHITDGLLSVNKVRKELIKSDSTNYYNIILEKHGFTRTDFDTSVFYYSTNISTYDEIYEQVLNKLTELEANIKEEGRTKERD